MPPNLIKNTQIAKWCNFTVALPLNTHKKRKIVLMRCPSWHLICRFTNLARLSSGTQQSRANRHSLRDYYFTIWAILMPEKKSVIIYNSISAKMMSLIKKVSFIERHFNIEKLLSLRIIPLSALYICLIHTPLSKKFKIVTGNKSFLWKQFSIFLNKIFRTTYPS